MEKYEHILMKLGVLNPYVLLTLICWWMLLLYPCLRFFKLIALDIWGTYTRIDFRVWDQSRRELKLDLAEKVQ